MIVPRPSRRARTSALLLILGFLPAIGVTVRALASDPEPAPSAPPSTADSAPPDPADPADPSDRSDPSDPTDSAGNSLDPRARVLSKMAEETSILINVTERELPASPDILNLGRRGVPALEKGLSDNVDAEVRRRCAKMLGALGDRRALTTLQTALDDWEPSVRAAAIESLAQIPDPSSFDPLWRLFSRQDEDDGNRAAILRALGALGSKKAVQALREQLRNGRLRAQAFDALWMSRHLMAKSTLIDDMVFALESGEPALILPATAGAAEVRSPRLVSALVPLLDHPLSGIRNKAVYALGLIGDRTATDALLAKLPGVREGRMLNNIAFALERLDREAFFASIRTLAEHKQAIIRLNAAFVLGDVKRSEGRALVEQALSDPNDLVKTSAVAALGKIGAKESEAAIEALTRSPNTTLREEAVYALHAVTGNQKADLIHRTLFLGEEGPKKLRAAMTLADLGDPRPRDYLLHCIESHRCAASDLDKYLRNDKDPRVGERLLLAWVRDGDALTRLVGDLRPAGTLSVASAEMDAAFARGHADKAMRAMDLATIFGDPSTKERVERYRKDPDVWVRIHAEAALARLGDATADEALWSAFHNLPAQWLPRFAAVLAEVREPETRARLLPKILESEKEADVEIALAAAAIHLAWDPEQAIFRWLDALGSATPRERALATRYLTKATAKEVTWVLRRALAREGRDDVRGRLQALVAGRKDP